MTRLSKYLPQKLFTLSYLINEALIAKQEGRKVKNKAIKQKHCDLNDFSVVILCMVDMGI